MTPPLPAEANSRPEENVSVAKSLPREGTPHSQKNSSLAWLFAKLAGAAVLWVALFLGNLYLWPQVGNLFGPEAHENRWLETALFFLQDSAQIVLLLVGMIFLIGMLRTSLRPEQVRDFLAGRPLWLALVAAAVFGAITPFCSCSSIPLFIGFLAAGIPLSVTLTFLIASPMINEVAVVVLVERFGPAITGTYVGVGLVLAVSIGALLSRFSLDHLVEDFVYQGTQPTALAVGTKLTLQDRVSAGKAEVREIVGRIWKWVLIGVGIGAVVHGWVPAEFFLSWAGPDNPFAVVIATLAGIPLYSNAAGVVPIAGALWDKGMATGTVLAFMMATVTLSLPEAVLLRQVLKPKLLAIFFTVVGSAIILVGLILNLVFS